MAKKEETPEAEENAGGEQTEEPVSPEEPKSVQEEEICKDARMWAMICHLAGLGWLIWWIVPLIGGVIGSLIVWQVKKDVHPFIDDSGKEACNFQISMLIYALIAGLLCFACVGSVLLPTVMVVDIVFVIVAAIKANDGQHYRYPLTIRFIK
jgi:uncharacterized Tic20 family protein